eukprot:superscaffoldBa00000671_g6472
MPARATREYKCTVPLLCHCDLVGRSGARDAQCACIPVSLWLAEQAGLPSLFVAELQLTCEELMVNQPPQLLVQKVVISPKKLTVLMATANSSTKKISASFKSTTSIACILKEPDELSRNSSALPSSIYSDMMMRGENISLSFKSFRVLLCCSTSTRSTESTWPGSSINMP